MSSNNNGHSDFSCNGAECFICTNNHDIALCKYYDAPAFLRENPYIIHGYRPVLSLRQCLGSVFLWTNETLNIWSHLLGFILCFSFMIYHLLFTSLDISYVDKVVLCSGLVCFQICLLCSTGYHIFKCHSAESYNKWLNVDFFGISLGFIGCILPAFHLGFYCFKSWYNFYMLIMAIISFIFICWHGCSKEKCFSAFNGKHSAKHNEDDPDGKVLLGLESLNSGATMKMEMRDNTKCLVGPVLFYASLSLTGLLPALHWAHLSGGLDSTIIQAFLPRVGVLYLIMMAAFIFYLTKFPERCFPGQFDFIGSSHQCWHVLIVVAFAWWYDTGYQLLQHMVQNKCPPLPT